MLFLDLSLTLHYHSRITKGGITTAGRLPGMRRDDLLLDLLMLPNNCCCNVLQIPLRAPFTLFYVDASEPRMLLVTVVPIFLYMSSQPPLALQQ